MTSPPRQEEDETLTYRKKDSSKGRAIISPIYLLISFTIVVVLFKGVGNAPIMKQNRYKITATNRFQAVIQFLRKELGWQSGEPLVSYAFST
jgi:ubiquitin-like protein ATG12